MPSPAAGPASAAADVDAFTLVEDNVEYLIPQIAAFFKQDIVAKGLSVPEYVKVPIVLNAVTPDGQICGSGSGFSRWSEVHIDRMSASPTVAVDGTRAALVWQMERIGRERGCRRISVVTNSRETRFFYEGCGFRVYGEREDYPNGRSRFFMEKLWSSADAMHEAVGAQRRETETAESPITVLPAEQAEVEKRLSRWLEDDPHERQIAEAGPYAVKPFALESRLADGGLRAGAVCETLWGDVHVSLFGCHDSVRRHGVGSAMMRRLIEIAKEKGCRRMSLETMSWQAQPFYEKHGFKVFGVQEGIPHEGMARIYMEKRW